MDQWLHWGFTNNHDVAVPQRDILAPSHGGCKLNVCLSVGVFILIFMLCVRCPLRQHLAAIHQYTDEWFIILSLLLIMTDNPQITLLGFSLFSQNVLAVFSYLLFCLVTVVHLYSVDFYYNIKAWQ